MTVANRKKLEATHHRWLMRILHVSWHDKITNKSIRERTGQEEMESIIMKRRLWWIGHVWRMDRIEEPTRYCIGFLRVEREEKDRGRIGQTLLRTT